MYNLAEIKNQALTFDRAELVDLTRTDKSEPEERYKAVVNRHTDKVAAVVSDRYNLVQHERVVGAVVNALQSLNIKTTGRILNGGNRVTVDLSFEDSKINISKGEDFVAGIRIINSYDKSTGISVLPHLKRLVCDNGMVVSQGFVTSYSITHVQKLEKDFESTIEGMIAKMIDGADNLRAMVNKCIGDSIEWDMMTRILEGLFPKGKKHLEAIQERLLLTPNRDGDKYTRWDLYNAFTNYATHGAQIKQRVESKIQAKAQKVLMTPLAQLVPKQQIEA